ncbi:MAG: efflux RND transporter permease subunit [Nitrococcus sp.]|nr:efflux RND transporter permease subunit [Nitrococcus sp.]
MKFTDIFIQRPVLAMVISLLILLAGLRALGLLPVRQYPRSDVAVITVSTVYVGADAELVKGFITTPLESEIASANGIDYLESTSVQGLSSISAHLELNYDPNVALTEITSKVNKVRSELPQAAEDPTIDVRVGQSTASMYLSFASETLDSNQITDYLLRVVQPQLATVAGVQQAEILGGRRFSMRIWLDPERMAALHVTPLEVREALMANNALAAVGKTKGQMISITLTASTDLHTVDQFEDLVVREDDATIIRLGDISNIFLGAENYDTSVVFSDTPATFIGITVLPTANPLTVIQDVREILPRIESQLPSGLELAVPYDATRYIEDAISEVRATLVEALAIVTVVIFLFLGSIRSVIIPVVAMPLSLIGAALIMLILGYSINLLTLLALVLAIGLVVDDAIIVVENIHRHIEGGMRPHAAAIRGARELAVPVIAMTITLVAVYAPIGFTGGLTGSLFSEFAFTLAGAVVISGVVALTLSPMMCSRLLSQEAGNNRFARWLDRRFEALKGGYQRRLHSSLNYRPVTYLFALAVLASCYFLYTGAQAELAPTEDQGIIIVSSKAAPTASLNQLELWTRELTNHYQTFEAMAHYFLLNGVGPGGTAVTSNTAISGMVLKPWGEREQTAMELQPRVQQAISKVAGLDSVAFVPPPLPGAGGGLPVQFVIGATDEPRRIYEIARELQLRADRSGRFLFTDLDLEYNRPQVEIHIDRNMAAALGLNMRELAADLGTMLGGGYVNRFSIAGRAYKVIPQVARAFRLNPDQLEHYQVRTESGAMVPLSTLVTLETTVVPQQLKRFQQLNAATLSAVPAPGVTLGEALAFLEREAAEIFPLGYSMDYAGQSRQFVQEGSTLVLTFFLAILVIYLVLAAQFESFRDPLIMLISVPMSISGALIFLTLGFSTINIYTQVGLITLIGVISKHGILMVEFANQLQIREGLDKREAIEQASAIRLRPILMTTAALVLAVVPLIIATGPGSQARFSIGLVVATGMTIGTLFTLFVVPAIYMLLAKDHAREQKAGAAQPAKP